MRALRERESGVGLKRIVDIGSRYVSARPTGVRDDVAPTEPPIGAFFLAFMVFMFVAAVGSFIEERSDWTAPDRLVGQMGMVGTTVFVLAGLLTAYRALSTRSPTQAPIAAILLGPGALWCWLAFANGQATGRLVTFLVMCTSGAIAVFLLAEGTVSARWLGVFCGLGAVGVSVSASLVNNNPAHASTVSLSLLMATAGMACLYGSLVEIESTGRKSFEELLDAKRRIEAEIAQTEDMLHDLRSGLLSIETAMATLDDDVSGPLRTETARLRKLTAKRKRQPSEFDMIPGIRDMVKARRTSGVTIDLRAPTSAQILGEESEVMAIVDNLLSNAMRHGADPVQVAIEEHSGHVKVRVTDSGRVVDATQTTGFFKRGFTSHSDGEGIGLDRARMLAELHNGTVAYEPGDDGKTSFVLTLPNSEQVTDDPKVVTWSPVGKS